jgi:hypothetical protein
MKKRKDKIDKGLIIINDVADAVIIVEALVESL